MKNPFDVMLILSAALMLLTGCATTDESPILTGGGEAEYLVKVPQTIFASAQPQLSAVRQAPLSTPGGGFSSPLTQQIAPPPVYPQMRLLQGASVNMVRPGDRLSLVMLPDGKRGYVRSQDIEPAPPPPVAEVVVNPTRRSRGQSSSSMSELYIPLPSDYEEPALPTDPLEDQSLFPASGSGLTPLEEKKIDAHITQLFEDSSLPAP